ncbi:uncharacterized protein EAF02_011536 [Botrytis sinoallii]|uniref:uncharacterized protein n=1 Tax=Botrytis sinoallii TaxID=1463999 RepID=UPI0018FFD84A|nr:uncharacterized protein EAF02_011536 [Botrytis sinoallii]KAF7855277.1 hypothetical protein EAF02_011536 [Botrytis sinoallii]
MSPSHSPYQLECLLQPTSTFCGLHRPSHSHSNLKKDAAQQDTSDALSTTSSKFRKQLVANARPLLLRRRDTSDTTRSLSNLSSKSKSSLQDKDKLGNRDDSHPSISVPPGRNLRLKKSQPPGSTSPNFSLPLNNNNPSRPSADFQWAREDQLSVILEYLEETTRSGSTPNSETTDPLNHSNNSNSATPLALPQPPPPLAIPETIRENLSPTPSSSPRTPKFNKIGVRERASNSKIPSYSLSRTPSTPSNLNTAFTNSSTPSRPQNLIRRSEQRNLEDKFREIREGLRDKDRADPIDFSSSALGIRMASSIGSERGTPEMVPRPIAHPPKDLESIARIDSSLIFEHFTTSDAWVLGSALRERLLPHPTPVVISISLSNANQVLFHCCTHSGTMPDNDSWVSRKRKTVLRWGVSTWYMWCKFEGDESAFARKYGLGNEAGDYAIHGGGVPIRVTGVEGVVACVVVSGLKQWEDHGVIVEVIRDLYY